MTLVFKLKDEGGGGVVWDLIVFKTDGIRRRWLWDLKYKDIVIGTDLPTGKQYTALLQANRFIKLNGLKVRRVKREQ